MNLNIAVYLFFRLLRWGAWIVFFGFALYFSLDRAPHLNSFGHLLPATELMMFGPGLVAVFAGWLELMMREKAGLKRPAPFQIVPSASN